MSYYLHGPFPFDVNAVSSCGRTALGAVSALMRTQGPTSALLVELADIDEKLKGTISRLGGWAGPADLKEFAALQVDLAKTAADVATTLARLMAEHDMRTAFAALHADVGNLRHTLTEAFIDAGAWHADVTRLLTTVSQRLQTFLHAGKVSRFSAEAAPGTEAGLYVIIADEGGQEPDPRIAGFWITFAPAYLEDGTAGPPDRYPPYVQGLLDAVTEEVWWRNLRVTSKTKGVWRPVIVLEWPALLANRSAMAPPGVRPADWDQDDGNGRDRGNWLQDEIWGGSDQPAEDLPVRPAPDRPKEAPQVPWPNLPAERSLISIVLGHLSYDSSTHSGQFHLVSPDHFLSSDDALPTVDWLDFVINDVQPAETESPTAGHSLGQPLYLPGDRVGFPLSGWLTRSLEIWPPLPAGIRPGELTERVVQSKWKAQAMMAGGSTFAVVFLVLSLSTLVRWAATPQPRPTATTPPPAPQPAMSVCSADHQKFVDELRCQVTHFAADPDSTEPVCGDPGSAQEVVATTRDLQAAYCGLLDRERDGWKGNFPGVDTESKYNFAELAASQACFNVLGHPYPYAQDLDFASASRSAADPDRFLRHRALGIRSLQDLTYELDKACEVYRNRVEYRVEGAIFATHVGSAGASSSWKKGEESSALRDALLKQSMVGVADDLQRCFKKGANEGLMATEYSSLCGPPDSVDRKQEGRKIWLKLHGVTANTPDEQAPPNAVAVTEEPIDASLAVGPDLLAQYSLARFGREVTGETSNLWQCHLTLQKALPGLGANLVATVWDQSVPVPPEYNIAGIGVDSQLVLDAALWAFEGSTNAGVCWEVVAKRLTTYSPVHPMLGELDATFWASEEQQLCGQVCAGFYRVAKSASDASWVTRVSDLDACLTSREPDERPDLGKGTLDRLRLPWNGPDRTGWVPPEASDICAFNLVAQEFIPSEEDSIVVGGKVPVQWSGETAPGSGIAGGPDGLAARAAQNLSSYGRSRSTNTCGHVALQCFSSLMVDVMGRENQERYEWLDSWIDDVGRLATASPINISEFSPWCQLVQPYMSVEGALPEGQIDLPCAIGVDKALRNVEGALRIMAADTSGEG